MTSPTSRPAERNTSTRPGRSPADGLRPDLGVGVLRGAGSAASGLVQRRPAGPLDLVQSARRAVGVASQQVGSRTRLHDHHAQRVGDDVVQLASEAAPLVGDQAFAELGLLDDQWCACSASSSPRRRAPSTRRPASHGHGEGEHPQHVLGARQPHLFALVDRQVHHQQAGDAADEVGVSSSAKQAAKISSSGTTSSSSGTPSRLCATSNRIETGPHTPQATADDRRAGCRRPPSCPPRRAGSRRPTAPPPHPPP